MKYFHLPVLAMILAALWACQAQIAPAKQTPMVTPSYSETTTVYYPQTGHSVQAPFLDYYLQHNGPKLLGFPITKALSHQGWQVQYFQFGRLEVHPENHPDYYITVGWLGELSNRSQPPVPNTFNRSARYFPETGHSVAGDFLGFFETNGNTVQFGRPISEVFINDGLLVQDFQSARFIWQPSSPAGERVQLEPLGEIYFRNSELPPSLLEPVPPLPDGF